MQELGYKVPTFPRGTMVRLTKTPEMKPVTFENSFKQKLDEAFRAACLAWPSDGSAAERFRAEASRASRDVGCEIPTSGFGPGALPT